MGEASSLFTGLKISNYYKYILYIAGVILIVSLFFEAKDVNNQWLRHVAFWTIITGLLIWFLDSYFIHMLLESVDYLRQRRDISVESADIWTYIILIGFWIFQILAWIRIFFMIVNR